MVVTAVGTVFLDGVQFTTDPQVYQPFNWEKRRSVHEGIGGAVTIQDFGIFAKDNTVRLASGAQGFMEQTVVETLHTKFRTKAAVFTLTDWVDNEFTVFIINFAPVPTFLGSLFVYQMELRVLGIAKLFGTVFVGP